MMCRLREIDIDENPSAPKKIRIIIEKSRQFLTEQDFKSKKKWNALKCLIESKNNKIRNLRRRNVYLKKKLRI